MDRLNNIPIVDGRSPKLSNGANNQGPNKEWNKEHERCCGMINPVDHFMRKPVNRLFQSKDGYPDHHANNYGLENQ
jgi:hypothetical protein